MTARQETVLSYIESSIAERGYPPTIREIGTHIGVRSTNGVNDHLHALERKGYITREDMKSRCIRLTNKPRPGRAPAPKPAVEDDEDLDPVVDVKVYHRIVAGPEPFLASNVATIARVGRSMVRGGPCFGLRLTGTSLLEAGYLPGDDVFFKPRNHVEPGQLACLLIGAEAAVWFVHPEKEYVKLQAASATTPPLLLRLSDWSPRFVLGVAVGMLRRYGAAQA